METPGDNTTERNHKVRSLSIDVHSIVVSASPFSLDISYKSTIYFTGSSSDQEIDLGDATQYRVGHVYEIFNDSSKKITIKTFSGSNTLLILKKEQRAWIQLQDNGTANGNWIISIWTKTGASTNISPLFGAGDIGVIVKGAYLVDRNVPTNRTGIPIATDGLIERVAVGVKSAGDYSFMLQKYSSPFTDLVKVRIVAGDGIYKTFKIDSGDPNITIYSLNLLENDAVAIKIADDSASNPRDPKVNFAVIGV